MLIGKRAIRILALDDDATMRALFSIAFRNLPVDLMLAQNAGEAKSFLEEQTPDAVLADLWLGEDNGLEIVEALFSQTGKQLPTLLVSAEGGELLREYVCSGRCLGFLLKPINLKTFGNEVLRYLNAGNERRDGSHEHHARTSNTGRPAVSFLESAIISARQFRSCSDSDLLADTTLARSAHRWIGASGIDCFPNLEVEARELERLAQARDLSELPRIRELLADIMNKLENASSQLQPA